MIEMPSLHNLGKEMSMGFIGLKHVLPFLMVRFQTTTLISIGLENTRSTILFWSIFRDPKFCR